MRRRVAGSHNRRGIFLCERAPESVLGLADSAAWVDGKRDRARDRKSRSRVKNAPSQKNSEN